MSIRQGLPHLYSTVTAKGNLTPSLSVEQFRELTKDGYIHLENITEKTDGMSFILGYDRHGFFTQHSGSGDKRAYRGSDHIMRAYARAREKNEVYDGRMPRSVSEIHKALAENDRLMAYLSDTYRKYGEQVIRGELFNRALGKRHWFTGEMSFVHTRYKLKHIGKLGTFILHSQLEDNIRHAPFAFPMFTDKYITFDHDIIEFTPYSVDVSYEVELFNQLDHSLIMRRATPKTKAAKDAENAAFNEIKKSVSEKTTSILSTLGIKNKWGSGTEGFVVHAPARSPEAPRFKITSREFQEAKLKRKKFR